MAVVLLILRVCLSAHAYAARADENASTSQSGPELYLKSSLAISVVFPATNAVIDQGTTPSVPINVSITSGSALASATVHVCESQDGSTCINGHSPQSDLEMPLDGPYQAIWKPPALSSHISLALNYLVWASAKNEAGELATSIPSSFTYLFPPTRAAALVVPAHDTGFFAPASPVLWATFSLLPDDPATVDHLDFLDGSTVIGSIRSTNSTPSGYALLWSNAPLGAHEISVRGVDSSGRTATSPSTLLYIVPPPSPIVTTLITPRTGDTFGVDEPIALGASAVLSGGAVERVEFVDGAFVIATAYSPPFEAIWTEPTIGHHAISARAFDDLGNASASPAAYVQTLAWPRIPTIVMLAPIQGATIANGTQVGLSSTVEAGDSPITHVDYYVDGNVVASVASAPYSASWSSSSVGPHVTAATAYDAQRRSATSSPIAFNVSATGTPPGGNPPPSSPTVSLALPPNNTTIVEGNAVLLSAVASEAGGTIARVDFKANEGSIGSLRSPPWNYSWLPGSPGSYQLVAVATDGAGHAATSSTVNILVSAPLASITLAGPAPDALYYPGDVIGLVPATLHVDGAVSRIEYFVDGVSIGSSNSPPYLFEWDAGSPGAYNITARVYDSAGNSALSGGVVFTVNPVLVNITFPVNGSTVSTSTVAIEGDYQGPKNIGIVVNGVVAMKDANGHFFLNALSLTAGQNTITATATSMGGSRVSKTIAISRSAILDPDETQIFVSEEEGIDSLSTRVLVNNAEVASWRVINLVGGSVNAGEPSTGEIATLSFSAPGLYTPTMEITDNQGRVTQKRIVLLVSSSADIVHAQMSVVDQFFDALSKENKARALATMTRTLAGQFASVYDALRDHWPDIIKALGPRGATIYGLNTFEAAIKRSRNGQDFLYLIEGMKDGDGVWRIDSF